MKRIFFSITSLTLMTQLFLFWPTYKANASPLDWINNKINTATTTKLSDTQVGAGLKEALRVGIENTIKLLGKQDGYLGNQTVKILLPKNIQNIEPALRKLGFGSQIDQFILSMNRAAEKSAPLAADLFASAISDMTIDDANKILNGSNTAATEYLKNKTYSKLLEKFLPSIHQAMDNYAVTKQYQQIADKIVTIPFLNKMATNVDINNYVASTALDGLFKVLGEQEATIRTNPSARVTDLLKQIFKK